MTRPSLLLLLAFALGGCATTSGSGDVRRDILRFEGATPTTGWKRLVTADVEFLTDLDPREAERGAALLTQSLEGLRAMFGKAPVLGHGKLVVIAMRDDLEFERRFGKFLWGFAAVSGGQTTVCLYGAPDRWFVRPANLVDATHSVLQHELAHAVLARYFTWQPRWFAEGMAQYLETFRWVDSETVLLGEPNVKAWNGYAAVRSLSVKDLLRWTESRNELEEAGFYGLSWAFVYYAINREPERFSALMAGLVEGDDAFTTNFGTDTTPLDRAIQGYLKHGQFATLRLKVPLKGLTTVKFEPAEAPTERLSALEAAMQGPR